MTTAATVSAADLAKSKACCHSARDGLGLGCR